MSIPVMFWSFVFYVVLQVLALKRFQGRWRVAAKIPAPIAIFIVATTIILALQGSNLFPIFLLLSGPILLIYISVLFLAHLVFNRAQNQHKVSP